jgi:hypothetical protein
MAIVFNAIATLPRAPAVFGIPVDFLLFGLTLLGVVVFHHHTMGVALAGLVTISIYKIAFTGFKTGAGVIGFVSHVSQEWVILANLFCLLMGFALLSRHFEKTACRWFCRVSSHIGKAVSLLVIVWILSVSRQHRWGVDRWPMAHLPS